MPTYPNKKLLPAIRQDIARWQHRKVQRAAVVAREFAPVDTGALQRSIRVSEPELINERVVVSLLAGGGEVDYAEEQELYGTAFMRPAMSEFNEY